MVRIQGFRGRAGARAASFGQVRFGAAGPILAELALQRSVLVLPDEQLTFDSGKLPLLESKLGWTRFTSGHFFDRAMSKRFDASGHKPV
jgi:hypothetical protein